MSKIFPYLFIILLAVGVAGLYYNNTKKPLTENLYSHLGGDFELQHISGPKTLKNYVGKATLLYFGFTSCPDICPLALSKLTKTLDALTYSQHQKLYKIFISVDYKRDGAQKVSEYVKFFSDDFIGLAGTQKQIEDITKKYAVHFKFVPMKDSAMKYTVDHTSRYYLINKKGVLIGSYSDITNDKKFINKLQEIL